MACVVCKKTILLSVMLLLTLAFFVVEIVYGYLTNSLALVSDSYHMLSDVVALIIGLASVRISKLSSERNTYGWIRAEVVGALTNAIFLVALCFTIFVEAIQRLTHDDHIEHPEWMLYVGCIGLGVNLIGLVLFHRHGLGHGHSHGHSQGHKDEESDSKQDKSKPASQLNMRAVFLHVMGDALGSVVVIISGLIIKFVSDKHHWKYKIDPAMSIVMIIIILSTTFPLVKESAMILLQASPAQVNLQEIRSRILSEVPGVLGIHQFHVWQLSGSRFVSSAHIVCQDIACYRPIAMDVKAIMHSQGIHSATVQLEFIDLFQELLETDSKLEEQCFLDCPCPLTLKCCNKGAPPPYRETEVDSKPSGSGDNRRRRLERQLETTVELEVQSDENECHSRISLEDESGDTQTNEVKIGLLASYPKTSGCSSVEKKEISEDESRMFEPVGRSMEEIRETQILE